MAFKTWQTGVHIQQDKVVAVALTRERAGWRLRRWWAVPLSDGVIGEGKILKPEQLVNALRGWRKTLPHSHRVFLSFRRRAFCNARCPVHPLPCVTANSSPG